MITAFEIGGALIEALGLPKQTSAFTLRVRAGEAVTVECEYYLESDLFVAELANYGLVSIDEPRKLTVHPADAMGYDAWRAGQIEAQHQAFMRRTSRLP